MEFELVEFETLFNIPLKNGLSKPKKIRGTGYPMVNMGELFKHDIIFDIEMDFVPMNEREKSHSYLKKHDLLFARQSLTLAGAGKCSIFLGESCETTYESHLIRVRLDTEKCNPLFYYYYFHSQHGKSSMSNIVEQVAAAGIRGSDLKKLKVPYIEKSIQDTIVELLYGFDKKIELNKQIINNMQEISKIIFKQWFIDFEFPNGEGKPYKSSGGEIVKSELGDHPKGWQVKSLDDIAKFQNGLAMQKFRPAEDNMSLPVLKIKELNQGNTTLNSERCSLDIKEEVKVFDGDVIFSWSGTLLVKLWTGGNAGLNQHLFKVTSEKYDKWFYYLWTKYYLRVFQARAAEKATTMGHIKRSHLKEAKIYLPSQETLTQSSKLLQPIIEKTIALGIETKKLAELRDKLLPKILAGKVEILDNLEV